MDSITSTLGWASQSRLVSSPAVIIAVLLIAVTLVTRLSSIERNSLAQTSQDGAKKIPLVPYWIPVLGHMPNMALDSMNFTRRLRDRYRAGAFALNLGGTVHNVVYSPGLATALLNQKSSVADFEHVSRSLMVNVFGYPSSELDIYDKGIHDIAGQYKYLLSEPSLGRMASRTADVIRANIANFVSFAPSPVDQAKWERVSGVKLLETVDREPVVEASLLQLTREFCAYCTTPSIMGTNFLNNFPDFFDDLWVLDRAFIFLAAGLPRWLPIPGVMRAHVARRRMIAMVTKFHEAYDKHLKGEDPGPDWRDLDDVGDLVRSRTAQYMKYDWSITGRASSEQGVLWAANANANILVFWMLNRIYADKTLLAMIREEIDAYVKAVQPKQEFPIPEPPRMETFDIAGLMANCPLLKSVYLESLRLDSASWSLKVVKQDFILQSRDKESQAWQLRQGEYAHAAHDLHNSDPNVFEDPLFFKPDRHIRVEGDKRTAEMGSIRPFGGGVSMCKGRSFATQECMMFTAAIVAMWDLEPASGDQWKMPKARKSTGVHGTDDNTRVRISRRQLPISS